MSNVRDFGVVGDGKADDTKALQHAINDGKGVLELPLGNYRITRPLILDLAKIGRRSVHGSGGIAKIIMAGSGPAFFVKGTHGKTADPGTFRPEEWQNERMPQIANLEIEGDHPEADGIRIEGVMQSTLTGLLIRQVRHGVHFTSRARNFIIDSCHIYHNTGVGVYLDHTNIHQAIIGDSHISYNRLGGIRVQGGEIRNFQITGNDIEYNNDRAHGIKVEPSAEIYIDVEDGSIREGTIVSNTIQATPQKGGANIRIIGSKDKGNGMFGLWTINGNMITSQERNIHLSSSLGVSITGNHLGNSDYENLLIEDSTQVVVGANCFGYHPAFKNTQNSTGLKLVNCDNSNVSGSVITGKLENFPNAGNRKGLVEFINCKRLNVTGLQVFDGTPGGIYLENCEDTLLNSCTVLDTREQKSATSITWTGSNKGNQISNSRFDAQSNINEAVSQQGNIVS